MLPFHLSSLLGNQFIPRATSRAHSFCDTARIASVERRKTASTSLLHTSSLWVVSQNNMPFCHSKDNLTLSPRPLLSYSHPPPIFSHLLPLSLPFIFPTSLCPPHSLLTPQLSLPLLLPFSLFLTHEDGPGLLLPPGVRPGYENTVWLHASKTRALDTTQGDMNRVKLTQRTL